MGRIQGWGARPLTPGENKVTPACESVILPVMHKFLQFLDRWISFCQGRNLPLSKGVAPPLTKSWIPLSLGVGQ